MPSQMVNDFLSMMAAEIGASKNTLDAYLLDLQQLEDFFQGDLSQMEEDDILAFVHSLSAEDDFASASIARKISTLNSFFNFLLSEKIIEKTPMSIVEQPKKDRLLPKFLTRNEIEQIIAAADDSKDWRHKRTAVMLRLMYVCGLRVSELINLPRDCINFDKKQILVKGKGSKERLVPVADKALQSVASWIKLRRKIFRKCEKNFLFPSSSSMSGHLTRDAVFKNIKTLAQKANLPEERVSPHVLRHSFASHLLDKDIDLRSVQTLLGHEDISTTEIYTHILPTKLLDAVQEKHPLAQKKN